MRTWTMLGVMIGWFAGGAAAGRACDPVPSGPDELQALLDERTRGLQEGTLDAARLAALEARIDEAAGQKDAAFSGLYWHRDRDEALHVAAATGRPIVTLRLLGELTCDRSCANSRFFRTALYADERVSALLRDRAVLHWQSVRPVPVVTIDMGDGRKLERTITGNSAHYVLTPQGEVVDVIPGLYGPEAFRAALGAALDVATSVGHLADATDRAAVLKRHHAMTAERLERQREAMLRGVAVRRAREAARVASAEEGGHPTAGRASFEARGKAMVERPLLMAVGELPLPSIEDEGALSMIAAARLGESVLDANARALFERKLRPGTTPEARDVLVGRFELRMAEDTVRNDLVLRPRALRRLVEAPAGVDAFNRWVYAELFLTPDEDPWLGLGSPGEFAALDADGVVQD